MAQVRLGNELKSIKIHSHSKMIYTIKHGKWKRLIRWTFVRFVNDAKRKSNGESNIKSINHWLKPKHVSSKLKIFINYPRQIHQFINGFIFVNHRCSNRTVTKAYHVCCRECSKKFRCCAKCLTSADEVNIEPAGPTPQEEVQLKVEMDRLMKSLPERKRRTFVRYMNKGKEVENGNNDADDKKPAEQDGKTISCMRVPMWPGVLIKSSSFYFRK